MLTPEERRERLNAYKRRYYKAHPEKAKQWRKNAILKAAARIYAEQAQSIQGGPMEADTTADQQTAPGPSVSE